MRALSRPMLARLAAGLALAAVVAVLLWRFAAERGAGEHREVVPLPSLGAELLFLDAGSIARRGPPGVVVVRFTRPVELAPYHFKADGLGEPATVEQWARALGVPMVFNAGQFDAKLEHLGWLKRDGRWLSEKRKPPWKGLLVSGPTDGAAWARIVDLDAAEAAVEGRYRHVIQSMMLLDSESKLRVRDTELSACRSVVAEDRRGRILFLITEGAVTLGDLARWLAATPLHIVRAMNLDGGIESQLAVHTPELDLAVYGQYGTGNTVFGAGGGQIRYPLPAVVAVRPVSTTTAPAP